MLERRQHSQIFHRQRTHDLTDRQHQHRLARWLLGSSIPDSIAAEDGKIGIRRSFKLKWRMWRRTRDFDRAAAGVEPLRRAYLQHVRPVSSPLALISEIQRSGGSLLSQLFDGHPELHAHPHELKIGYPKKYIWPRIDLDQTPQEWFETLFEDIVVRHFRDGYKKMEKYEDTFLFIFLPSLQRDIFTTCLASRESVALRDVFNAYMTSYFGAWVNNQNVIGEKKFITAFTPRLANRTENTAAFFEVYPEGRLISIIRDPKNWYPSARKHNLDKYGDIRHALNQWNESARAMVRNKKTYNERVRIVRFEDLIRRTEPMMRYLSHFLGIRFDEVLLTPTFNKLPVKPNTSFRLEDPGITVSVLSRYKDLSEEELKIINEMTQETYAEAIGAAASPA
jgi:hypothetical protein